ncbi:MAG TPA: DUF3418 domain-containing protein, partial [Marmoricola sp.]
ADRVVPAGRNEPEVARELFIRHALVDGDWNARHRFLQTNRRLLDEAEELEHRARRRGIVVDEETLVDFYDARVPADVVSGAHFDAWWKQARHEQPDLLTFDPGMLVRDEAAAAAAEFPDTWQEERLTLPLSYHFEPGAARDGVSVDVPLATLNTVAAEPFSWQVPGMRYDLVVALIRGLPKQLRVNFVPVPDVARAFLADVSPGEESLTEALSRYLRGRTGVHVPADAWDRTAVPGHLLPTFRVVAEDGSVMAEGKDLDVLKEPLARDLARALDAAAGDSDLTVSGATSWTFGTLPSTYAANRAGHEVRGFPALVDEGSSVGVRILGREDDALAHHRRGLRRLLMLEVESPASSLVGALDNAEKLALAASPYPNVAALIDDCVLAAVGEVVTDPVRDPQAYDHLLAGVRTGLVERSRAVLGQVVRVLGDWRETDRLLHGRVEIGELSAMTDLRAQLGRLFSTGFVADAGPALAHYPRYLAAMRLRAEHLAADPHRDRLLQERVAALQDSWQHRIDALAPGQPPTDDLVRARWQLEEFRVSLWAQQLGTAEPVSDQRIRKLLGG